MPHGGGRKRKTPRKAYAQKAAAQKHSKARGPSGYPPRAGDARAPGFSMFEAARNTEHRGGWGDKKLRYTRIEFVNATSAETSFRQTAEAEDESDQEGSAEELDDQKPSQDVDAEMGIMLQDEKDPAPVDGPSTADIHDPFVQKNSQNAQNQVHDTDRQPQQSDLFFIDTVGDASLKSSKFPVKSPVVASATSEGDASDSSDEVIVFKGRNTSAVARRDSPRRTHEVRIIEEDIKSCNLNGDSTAAASNHISSTPRSSHAVNRTDSNHREEGATDDYVANLLAQDEDLHDLAAFARATTLDPHIDRVDERYRNSEPASGEEWVEDDEDDEEGDEDDDDSEGDSDSSPADVDSEDEAPDESRLDHAANTMSDEQLARRLAKQEELGLGSKEILLWGEEDMAGIDDEEEEEEEFPMEVLRHAAQKLSGKQSKRAKRQNGSVLPQMLGDLDMMGDDYGDFDILDFERPSVQRRGKGSKSLPFAVSDSELESKMTATWENDRVKKKQRKIEREQLRAQGLIGGGENIKMRQRYPTGISAAEIRDEIALFLSSDSYKLELIPMDKRLRKAVHDVCNKLNLRSKSKGSGFDRYPCLYKTSNTLPFDAILVDATLRRYGGGKGGGRFKNQGGGRGARPERPRRGGGGGGVTSGVSYRDGETVGASAPALGVENRGHAMLAKMGWTTGTALGALDNKGSLEPVPHVVKATRAGLG